MPGAITSGSDPGGYDAAGGEGSIVGALLGGLNVRDETTVRADKASELQGSPGYNIASTGVFAGLNGALGLPTAIAKAILQTIIGIPLNFVTGTLQGLMALFTGIPASQITNSATSNLILNPQFSVDLTGWNQTGSAWAQTSSDGNTAAGAAVVAANGTTRTLLSTPVLVKAGDKVIVKASHKRVSGAGSGTPIQVQYDFLDASNAVISTQTAGSASGTGSAGWATITGAEFTAPALSTSVRVRLTVTSGMTGGTVYFDDVSLTKSGLIAPDVVTGLVDLGTAAYGWITGFFNGITGQTMTNVPVSAANQQAAAIADNLAAQAAALAALQAQAVGGGNSGLVSGDDFERLNTTDLGSGWSIAYGGGGTNVLCIANSHDAWWTQNVTTFRAAAAIKTGTDASTVTDYQRVTMVEGAQVIVSPFGGGSDAENSIYVRIGSGAWVRAQLNATGFQWTCRLLYANGGSEAALTINPSNVGGLGTDRFIVPARSAGTTWTLEAGTLGGLRVFRLIRNGSPVFTFTDTGSLTAAGSLYRGWGFGMGGGQFTPSSVTRVTVADNAPTATIGSFARVSRVNTGGVSFATTSGAVYPASFFDTVDRISTDISWNASTNTFVVRDSGVYDVEIGLITGIWPVYPNTFITPNYLRVLVNGVVQAESAEMAGVWTMQSGTAALSQADSIKMTSSVYASAGDSISLGYNFSVAKTCLGSANGLRSYVQLAKK